MQRAEFSPDLLPLRNFLPELLPTLEADQDWYGSIYLEKKSSQTFLADLKKTQVLDQVSQGIVLRIYDGYTLYEQATDELDFSALKATASKLADRVRHHQSGKNPQTKKTYRAPTWKERLSTPHEKEILDQIPPGVNAQTQVHFGIRFENDPRSQTPEQKLAHMKNLLARCVELGAQHQLSRDDLSYARAREAFSIEESIFIDRESNLSQKLFRISLSLILMSGSERVSTHVGGLGGTEAIELKDEQIHELLKDLSALRNAERLQPGRYRVLFSPELSGVLAHEAFGHSQEGDTCARGRSKAWDLFHSKESVGNENATILNNPAIYTNGTSSFAAWGSFFFDEEGWLAQEHVLLDRGILNTPMTHLTSSIQLGVPRTANGKRESWASGVYTRQTNTYFSAGKETLNDLYSKIQDGFLAGRAAGGMEDPKGMGIQVGIAYLKEIKNGKLTGRVFKGPNGGDIQMTGYTPDVLNSIIGKSKVEFDSNDPDRARFPENDVGGCGKYHKESVLAGCGGPYMLLDQVILG